MQKKASFTAAGAAALAVLALSAPARAQSTYSTYSQPPPSTPGFYVGGSGGWGWTGAELSGGTDFSVSGSDWGLFAGYDFGPMWSWGETYGLTAAIEGHYSWANGHDTSTIVGGGGATSTLDKNDEWGFDFRPGISFADSTMPLGMKPYAILGYRHTDYDNSTVGDVSVDGFALGAGAEMLFYRNFGVRMDYTHAFNGADNHVHPEEDDIRFGVAYHF
jgi:opacity protein-like surface antigen